ncbi:MAG TPA: hypothetical protein VKY65_14655 [Alphaproteobacteria bacterium]|nr:hypothetical protein [Alphaproteobacteria bacterium]
MQASTHERALGARVHLHPKNSPSPEYARGYAAVRLAVHHAAHHGLGDPVRFSLHHGHESGSIHFRSGAYAVIAADGSVTFHHHP